MKLRSSILLTTLVAVGFSCSALAGHDHGYQGRHHGGHGHGHHAPVHRGHPGAVYGYARYPGPYPAFGPYPVYAPYPAYGPYPRYGNSFGFYVNPHGVGFSVRVDNFSVSVHDGR